MNSLVEEKSQTHENILKTHLKSEKYQLKSQWNTTASLID